MLPPEQAQHFHELIEKGNNLVAYSDGLTQMRAFLVYHKFYQNALANRRATFTAGQFSCGYNKILYEMPEGTNKAEYRKYSIHNQILWDVEFLEEHFEGVYKGLISRLKEKEKAAKKLIQNKDKAIFNMKEKLAGYEALEQEKERLKAQIRALKHQIG